MIIVKIILTNIVHYCKFLCTTHLLHSHPPIHYIQTIHSYCTNKQTKIHILISTKIDIIGKCKFARPEIQSASFSIS